MIGELEKNVLEALLEALPVLEYRFLTFNEVWLITITSRRNEKRMLF